MTLGDFEILPGVVIVTDDPLNQGRVKACAPGLFDTETMAVEDLFWINPFMMIGHQSFSKLNINSKIWILHNIHNYFEYWYIPMFEINETSPSIQDTDSDVLFSRSVAGESVQMYYSRNNGLNLNIGKNGMQLLPTGEIKIVSSDSNILLNESGIQLSYGNNSLHPVAKADKIIDILNTLSMNLKLLSLKSSYNIYTCSLSMDLYNTANALQSELNSIQSEYVKIS